MRVVFYCNNFIGVGHFVRTHAIASQLGRKGASVTLVSGGTPIPELPISDRVQFVQLPSLRISSETRKLETSTGRPVTRVFLESRSRLIAEVLADNRPDFFVIEHFPFGRYELGPELLTILKRLQPLRERKRIQVVSSVRDIVVVPDDPATVQRRIVDRIERFFDVVLVHADGNVFNFESQFPVGSFSQAFKYTGYVVEAADGNPSETTPEIDWMLDRKSLGDYMVVVSIGGGREGNALVDASTG